MKTISELYGECPDAFDYDKQPNRGSQRGKRDFSHKSGVIKYHEDPNQKLPHAL